MDNRLRKLLDLEYKVKKTIDEIKSTSNNSEENINQSEIWRKNPQDLSSPSISITQYGDITINCYGLCVSRSIEDWHRLAMAQSYETSVSELKKMKSSEYENYCKEKVKDMKSQLSFHIKN